MSLIAISHFCKKTESAVPGSFVIVVTTSQIRTLLSQLLLQLFYSSFCLSLLQAELLIRFLNEISFLRIDDYPGLDLRSANCSFSVFNNCSISQFALVFDVSLLLSVSSSPFVLKPSVLQTYLSLTGLLLCLPYERVSRNGFFRAEVNGLAFFCLETAKRRKVSADVKSQRRNCARRKMRRAQKRLRLTFKHGQTTRRCAGGGKLIWTETSLWKRENMAERSPDVSCAIKMAMNSPLDHRKMTKKRAGQVHIN